MKKLDYSDVKNSFEEQGYTLISENYINAKQKLDYLCPKGHRHSITWGNWSTGYRCAYCSHNPPIDINHVKLGFEDEGYTLLTKEYVGAKHTLNFICKEDHKHFITWDCWQRGNRCNICRKEKLAYKPPASKGGVKKLNIPLYSTYARQLNLYEQVYEIKDNNLILLGVECTYCNKIYIPKATDVYNRLRAIDGTYAGEQRFYCSNGCKKACSIFKKQKYPNTYAHATSREVQPQLRKLVLERDNWTCQKCSKDKDVQLHCHHIDPVVNNPIESADIDNCITLCKSCHKEVHRIPGCGYKELGCIKK